MSFFFAETKEARELGQYLRVCRNDETYSCFANILHPRVRVLTWAHIVVNDSKIMLSDTETRNVLEFVLLHNEGLPRLRHDSNDRRGPSRTLSRRIAKAHKLHRELKGKLRASVRHVAARGV